MGSTTFDKLVFVDCETLGPCPGLGTLQEFGAVHYTSRKTFHGVCSIERWVKRQLPQPMLPPAEVFRDFYRWLVEILPKGLRPILVSDNPAWDFMWIQDGFWRHFGSNPFGHSARRISDFYAGLTGDFTNSQEWKRLRMTKHDHHPVHDALGNVEAFERMLKGERGPRARKLADAVRVELDKLAALHHAAREMGIKVP